MVATDITNSDDTIDIRDVIARVEQLRDDKERDTDDQEELGKLEALLEECKDNGGDEEWEDHWYPITLIRDSYFQDYAMELAEEIGAIKADASWPNNYIDWGRAAEALQMDYTEISFDGVSYWVR